MPSRPMPVSKVVPESGAKPMLSQGLIDQVLIDQAARQGAAPDLMYVVDLPGYELAVLSVGVINDEGFGAFYNASGGRQVEMRVDRGPYACVGTCEWDGDGWYAEHEGQEEYVAVRPGHHVRLICPAGQVDRAVLKQAAQGARPAVGDMTPAPPRTPVKGGDLFEKGDGVPVKGIGG